MRAEATGTNAASPAAHRLRDGMRRGARDAAPGKLPDHFLTPRQTRGGIRHAVGKNCRGSARSTLNSAVFRSPALARGLLPIYIRFARDPHDDWLSPRFYRTDDQGGAAAFNDRNDAWHRRRRDAGDRAGAGTHRNAGARGKAVDPLVEQGELQLQGYS